MVGANARAPSTQTNGSTNNGNRDRFPGHSLVNIAWERLNTRGNREGTAGVNEVRQPLEEIVDWVWANALAPLCP